MVTERDVLHVQLFGAFTLTHDGEQLPPLPSRHARLLFAWLALQHGRPQARSLLCHHLWPDVPESRARRRLSHALWQIQDAFGEGLRRPYLLTPGDHVQFDVEAPYRLDVEEFEQRLDAVDRAGTTDVEAVRHLRRCVELYRGDLLAGSYEDWVVREQDRLRQRHVTALVRLVDACKQRGNFDEALAVARRLTHHAPLQEEAHREVMKLCVLTGQPDLALEQYERCRSVLEEELGIEPSAATLELHDRILQHRHTDTSRPAPLDELASTRLVARDEERIVLVDALERTLVGHRGTVFVEGEPGVGKTQLLAHAAEDARWRGFTVLWGTCEGTTAPYAALRTALQSALDPVRVAQLRALLAPVWLAEAGRLLPALRGGDEAPISGGLAGSDAAERMRQALVEVVLGLAASDPVVLVLEDVHAADAETMAVLRALARHPEPGRLLALLSYRDVDARQDDDVWERLRQLDRDARPVRLHLDALTPFATGALLREVLGEQQLPASFVEAVQREGGGNPLYTLELLRSLRDTGALAGGADTLDTVAVPVTADLRALVRGRLALLGWEAATVAEFAAVLDDHADLTSLEAGVGLGPRQLSTAVAELTRRNLLQHDGGLWRFTHAATRRVLLDDLLPQRRRELHAAAADALEAAYPDDVEAIAEHLVRAELPRRALPHLRRAAARALDLHAHATAAQHLDAALDAIEHVPTSVEDRTTLLLQAEAVHDVLGDRDRQQVLLDDLRPFAADDPVLATELAVRRAHLLGHLDELDAALDAARGAVERAPHDDLRGRALAVVGELLHWQGHQEEAVDALRTALATMGSAVAVRTRARATLASALRALQRYDDARAILADAAAAAREQGDEVGLVHALGGLADLDSETGHSDAAVERYAGTIEQARRVGFRHREGVALVNLATVRLARAEPGPALTAYDEADTVFRTLGNRRGTAIVRLNRAWLCHRWLGRDDDAERDALAALEYSQEVGSSGLTSAAQETLAGIARRHGEFEVAADHLAAGLDAATAAGDRRAVVQLRRGEVELALASGDQAVALATAVDAADEASTLGLLEFVADLRALAATAAMELGHDEEAVRWARGATTDIATSGEPHRVHHHLGLVAEATDAPATAVEHHRAAARLLGTALEPLPTDLRRTADRVPTHRSITAAAAPHLPRTVELRMARATAPLGRPLEADETLVVELAVAPPTRDPAARRAHLLEVLRQVEEQHAAATVDDLGMVFDVSPTTIRRDLEALRRSGHDATTRGRDAG